ncbi:MAG: response regulator [Candidatus Cloacimonetes bacterium]|nr:response regulator [Candidatus Cloacimonadota bacterium]MCF7813100.1 response regulator [Candidatus Cloacimonadota bacterium]MCF7867548.1 response regulator [Candidatus Cloacimonadota bacterium]MCF7883058.1 response regulator [Candidatus Cloacimonadota bacterium]
MKSNRPILVVEDDLVDAMTVKRALKEIEVSNEVIVKQNGEDALEYLQSEIMELPAIILLDLNMPRMNGIEFLRTIKQDEKLLSIPVVVLTTSRSEQDKLDSYKLGVAGYIIKSVNYQEFVEMIKKIENYWDICEFPI